MHSFISFSKTLSDLFIFQNPTRSIYFLFFCASDYRVDISLQIAYWAELLSERTRCVFWKNYFQLWVLGKQWSLWSNHEFRWLQIAYWAELLYERARCVFFPLFSENNDVYEAIRSSWENNEVYQAIMNSDDLQKIDLQSCFYHVPMKWVHPDVFPGLR